MKWKNVKIGTKILIGIGSIITLLIVVGGWSWNGIDGIVDNATELSGGNKLVGVLLQKEVDHLNWAGDVSRLLNDSNVTELTVQLDHTKCAFGKWLYGKGRAEAESFLPELRSFLKTIEKPHQHLHESARKLNEVWSNTDEKLPALIAGYEIAHLSWAEKVQYAILEEKTSVGVELNHTQCGFGRMLFGDFGTTLSRSNSSLAKMLEEIKQPHKLLHESGLKIEAALGKGQFPKAREIFFLESKPLVEETRSILGQIPPVRNEF